MVVNAIELTFTNKEKLQFDGAHLQRAMKKSGKRGAFIQRQVTAALQRSTPRRYRPYRPTVTLHTVARGA